jgi:hypothetical protein
MTPEQIQDIVMNTIAAAMDTGDLIDGAPEMREMPDIGEMMPEEQMMPEEPMMPEGPFDNEPM